MKKINVEKIWISRRQQQQKTYKKLKKKYQELSGRLERMKVKETRLKKSGIEYGTPSWKTQITRDDGARKRYLRILYPNGRRKYIGCKEDKTRKALDSLKRGRIVKVLQLKIRKTESEIKTVIHAIRSI